ncbi:type II toxin-antitoxin system prevent-host-death family antitoxin [Candidatus Uhrbacteria bacterium]|nr:type II toxin-antitoxin system prevent-host-death family antitoxin [Candidatus Uhrbacteria bacterium]
MEDIVIGVKQFRSELKKVIKAAEKGQTFIVTRHSKPLFRVTPIPPQMTKKYASLHWTNKS